MATEEKIPISAFCWMICGSHTLCENPDMGCHICDHVVHSCQVTVVSVASPTSNSSQKSVALPVNVALGQQILTVQQPASVSPVKVATSQTTAQVRGKDRAGLSAVVWVDLLQAGKR